MIPAGGSVAASRLCPVKAPRNANATATVASEIRGSRRTRNAAALSRKRIPQTHTNGGCQIRAETKMPPPNARTAKNIGSRHILRLRSPAFSAPGLTGHFHPRQSCQRVGFVRCQRRSRSSFPITGFQGMSSYCASPFLRKGSPSRTRSSVPATSLSGTRNSKAPPTHGIHRPGRRSEPLLLEFPQVGPVFFGGFALPLPADADNGQSPMRTYFSLLWIQRSQFILAADCGGMDPNLPNPIVRAGKPSRCGKSAGTGPPGALLQCESLILPAPASLLTGWPDRKRRKSNSRSSTGPAYARFFLPIRRAEDRPLPGPTSRTHGSRARNCSVAAATTSTFPPLLARKAADRKRCDFHGRDALEAARQRHRKQAHAGVKVQRVPALVAGENRAQQFVHQEPVRLKKGSGMRPETGLPR